MTEQNDTSHGDDTRRSSGGDNPANGGASDSANEDNRLAPPTVIGWMLRGFSVLLIGTLMLYLLAKALSPTTEFRLAIAPQWSDASKRDGGMLVPIDITNDSTQTVRNLSFEVQPVGRDPIEIEIALFGPGEKFTYVVNIAEQSEPLAHRVLHFEK